MKKTTLRLSDSEYEKLIKYCESKERTINDVLRECVRNLELGRKQSES